MTAVDLGASSGVHAVRREGFAPRLTPGVQLGEYVLGEALWPLRIADAYRANGPKGPATIYVVHAAISVNAGVRDAIIAGTRTAAALPEHKHLVRTLAAGLTGEVLWIATEEIDGSLVRDLLSKKRSAGTSGFGTRGTGNLIAGVASALGDHHHGTLASESVSVNRTGRVRVVDLALAQGTAAAIIAGLVPPQGCIAPEILAGAAPNGPADVYGVGALLYEALVGQSLERGGPRPSEVVANLSSQIDEIVARACHRDPEKRFGRADVLGEVVSEALTTGGAVQTSMVPKLGDAAPLDEQVMSLATELGTQSPSASGNAVVDRALQAALADSTEKWLVSKGKLDYGPFSLADVVKQITKGEITAGNIIMDKDTGNRVAVDKHPLLGPMVETARQQRDDQRRAQAEVVHQSREKSRGVMLYVVIGAGVIGVALAVWFIIKSVRSEEGKQVAGISALDGASLNVKVSAPKAPPPRPKRTGGQRPGGGGSYQNAGGENLALDMSDDEDGGGGTLDMNTVFAVYSKYGGQLGGCLQSNGEGSASISIIIDGPSGRVTFVRVNGKTAGGTWSCLGRVLKGMKFPTLKSGRTRAEFDIAL
ncbi:MAG: hypothetical protein H0T79_12355 [Deltaproteobacteria bacterium]|nr:hypothetical protein [Deltaproteobacteria bacterium]